MHLDGQKGAIKFISMILALVIISNLVIYYFTSRSYENKVEVLNQKIDSLSGQLSLTNSSLSESINQDRKRTDDNLASLESKNLNNFKKLQDYFNSETLKIRLDLENVKVETASDLSSVSTQLGSLSKKNSELEDKLSEISVTSSDFSSIIEDVVKGVVTIKTNLGQASGVIFDSRGYIITNKHVIEGVSSASIIDYNSKTYSVSLVGVSSSADLAILKINSNDTFNALKFADVNDIKVGTKVIAVGNPLGLSFSVTEGIISGVNRNVDNSGLGYVQTDVPINPGNSGGPLIGADKKIIGINTFKITNTEGIGFAIPANIAKSVADQAV